MNQRPCTGEPTGAAMGERSVSGVGWSGRAAGRSVAVGESHPNVLAASSEQVAEPEEGGVADWIEQNLLVAV